MCETKNACKRKRETHIKFGLKILRNITHGGDQGEDGRKKLK